MHLRREMYLKSRIEKDFAPQITLIWWCDPTSIMNLRWAKSYHHANYTGVQMQLVPCGASHWRPNCSYCSFYEIIALISYHACWRLTRWIDINVGFLRKQAWNKELLCPHVIVTSHWGVYVTTDHIDENFDHKEGQRDSCGDEFWVENWNLGKVGVTSNLMCSVWDGGRSYCLYVKNVQGSSPRLSSLWS